MISYNLRADNYVQRQILQTVSVLYKRRKLCGKSQQAKTLVEITEDLFKSSENIETVSRTDYIKPESPI
jgi:hypothetical protein